MLDQKQLYTCYEVDLSTISAIASCFQSSVMYRYNDVRNDTYLIVVNPEGKRIVKHLYVKITCEYIIVQLDKIQ